MRKGVRDGRASDYARPAPPGGLDGYCGCWRSRHEGECKTRTCATLNEKNYSGEFRVRIPSQLHRLLALQAAEQGVSLNRLASAKLAG